MKPWIGITLAGGAVVALGTAVYFEKRASAASSTPATINFIGGDQTTVTVALPGAISLASPPTIASVTTSLQINAGSPNNYTVTSATTSTTGVTLLINAAASATELASTFATAVGAPATAAVTAVDNGPSNPASTTTNTSTSSSSASSTPSPAQLAATAADAAANAASANAVPSNAGESAEAAAEAAGIAAASANAVPSNAGAQVHALTAADDNTPIDVNVGDTITVTLTEGGLTFASSGTALQGNGVQTSGNTQVATYKAVAAGASTITASSGAASFVPDFDVDVTVS